jgi:hypothetical protein
MLYDSGVLTTPTSYHGLRVLSSPKTFIRLDLELQ